MCKKIQTIILVIALPLANLYAQTDTSGAGYALNFPEFTGSYVNVGDILDDLQFPFTIEAWIDITAYQAPGGSIFSSDNDLYYFGFWFNVSTTGNLSIEFGNGEYNAIEDRRGFITTTVIPLHKWVHVAAVCDSASGVRLYFNGIEQPIKPTDGESTYPFILHNSTAAEIGRFFTVYGFEQLFGQIDELRIWKTSRSRWEIQHYMCRRVTPTNSLVGYWRGEGSLGGLNVKDFALIPHDGIVSGNTTKVISGAPIGDTSVEVYGNFMHRKSIFITDPSGDTFKVNHITGSPSGVFVYRVNEKPYHSHGLLSYPNHYFGVFCVENDSPVSYAVIYKYSNTTLGSEAANNMKLFTKATDSIVNWVNAGGILDSNAHTITHYRPSMGGDYILDFVDNVHLQPETDKLNLSVQAFPSPATNQLTILLPVNAKCEISIANVLGQIVYAKNLTTFSTGNYSIDISNLPKGIYIVSVGTSTERFESKFVKQ